MAGRGSSRAMRSFGGLTDNLNYPENASRCALEIASLMLDGQRARGYCLEMICADFLAGANPDASGNAGSLLLPLSRICLLLPNSQRQEFLLRIPKRLYLEGRHRYKSICTCKARVARSNSRCQSRVLRSAGSVDILFTTMRIPGEPFQSVGTRRVVRGILPRDLGGASRIPQASGTPGN